MLVKTLPCRNFVAGGKYIHSQQPRGLVPLPDFDLYRPQKKLREGNVYTGVCLFTGGAGIGIITQHAIGQSQVTW